MKTFQDCADRLDLAIRHFVPYNDERKREFKNAAIAYLRKLSASTGIAGDVRFNPGGIAVSGEAALHGDKVYVQISAAWVGILFRTCKGRKDYTGGPNQWGTPHDLRERLADLSLCNL